MDDSSALKLTSFQCVIISLFAFVVIQLVYCNKHSELLSWKNLKNETAITTAERTIEVKLEIKLNDRKKLQQQFKQY